jgi:hypothetical protein
MLSINLRRLIAVSVILASGVIGCEAAWWQNATPATILDAKAIAGVWKTTDADGQPAEPKYSQISGKDVLIADGSALTLNGPAFGAGVEITIRFAMNPSPAAELSGDFTSTSPYVNDSSKFSVESTSGSDTLAVDALGNKVNLQLRGTYQRSLNYPDRLRKILDHEMTEQTKLTDRWLSIRFVLRSDAPCEMYVNDILVQSSPPHDSNVGRQPAYGGNLHFTISPGVQVLSITTRPVLGGSLFEPIHIDSRLNARQIDGSEISSGSVPVAGAVANISNIPFAFPNIDRVGNDHIDLRASWLQTGYMEGDFPPNSGLLGGRWIGPTIENPSRIQFQLPKGRYNALHLICAADDEKDTAPIVTAQFFWPDSGRPESFSTRVPFFSARSADAVKLPVTLRNGKAGSLYLVTIPIDPGALAAFGWNNYCDLEITKDVDYYRCYPDPCEFSVHAAGLPSSVQVYAMTLERPAVTVEMSPDTPGNVWEAPDAPSYIVRVRNQTGSTRQVSLNLTTRDYYGKEKTSQSVAINASTGAEIVHRFVLKLKRYGYHDVVLTQVDNGKVWKEKLSLAYLHPDTRERGDWKPGRGPIFGYWPMVNVHGFPPADQQTRTAWMAGAETVDGAFLGPDATAEKLKIKSFFLAADDIWITKDLLNHMSTTEEAEAFLKKSLEGKIAVPSAISDPRFFCFFAEPSLGPITTGIPPDYYGEDYKLSAGEQANLDMYSKAFVIAARYIKRNWPNAKCLLPYGDPIFPVYFLRTKPEVRELVDGMGVDIPAFERLAEQQIHQLSIHRCYVMREEFRKAGIKDPIFAMVEGPAVATHPCSLSLKESADNSVRLNLLLYAHGINRVMSCFGSECNSWYGEQHYGTGGFFNRNPIDSARPGYPAMATMIRHINRKNLEKWLPTGSLSTYALQFKHYRTGQLTDVFWTVRGKRPVTLMVKGNAAIKLYDQMDNCTVLRPRNGRVTFTIDQSPCYVEGFAGTPKVTLGAPDHSDAKPAPAVAKVKPEPKTWSTSTFPLMNPVSRPPVPMVSRKLGNIGDGKWKLSTKEDQTYANNSYLQVARFPGNMSVSVAKAPVAQGDHALEVHLGKQAKDRNIMPFYTSLVPSNAISIPGKASHIGLWARGASDWGRVVYCLRDAKGERWLSVGTKNDFNCDDTYSASFFCFDGWRYLRFEMPSNTPYDQYRELGSTWWGHHGGDGLVDLPLKLEKIIVERRTHAMYVNDPQPTRKDDVLLGDLYAEYEKPEDCTKEAIRLNDIRMPVPQGMPDLGNPIAELQKSGVGAPTTVTKITLPSQDADGTKCFVHFDAVPSAQSYDVWVSPYEDGRGAFKLGSGWGAPGQMISGLRQDTDFYIFVVYRDANGAVSKPSKPFKIHLEDVFGMK